MKLVGGFRARGLIQGCPWHRQNDHRHQNSDDRHNQSRLIESIFTIVGVEAIENAFHCAQHERKTPRRQQVDNTF